jgi:hypothetical protein
MNRAGITAIAFNIMVILNIIASAPGLGLDMFSLVCIFLLSLGVVGLVWITLVQLSGIKDKQKESIGNVEE